METFSKKLETMTCNLLVAMAMIIITLGIIQVFTRYVLKNSMIWTEEAMRYLHVWITMVGATVGLKRGYFTVITIFYDFVKKKSKLIGTIIEGIQVISPVIFFTIVAYYGLVFVLKNLNQLSATVKISMGIIYIAIPLCGFLGLGISLSAAIIFFRKIFVQRLKS